ncbi:DUF3108 domain-containing protein [Xanthomonas hortorum]|uniref:DUF3108 domain-containing protein n=1 Tax=Xanthomonas hortorum pv. pelargonii TaxID=453602 RepID=A0A6V7CM97_9XANT|nr:DUF3108 domain-containing protein [Xanthomonas hortorum]MCE4356129.1 DUF3108 domain-containing protein [Xanthomonas hortorum pv. pelargonii]MCM5526475.1 DUF3108 domain-containing protein [Xanthomonas hortorum pv. pelargonii]MCM5538498.1 DUF3108 domain-containing protein [Xanthomonas hortorum pv. pelargonii]MCM5542711.1 DUF3108 domain-containing protein [Xanthomonas hortorum pv. pelargonii]MCM5546741.1 DUF3108 domain-containing protein [Xanthomonas hortorum pv. pelargonii]
MKSISRTSSLIAAAALAVASLPAFAVQPFQADYSANYMGMQANGTMTLAAAGDNQWRYTLTIQNQLANLTQSTVFEESNGQLRPVSSNDTSSMMVKRRNVTANYDWKTNQATWGGDIKADRRGPVQLKTGDMDALLINLAITRDLAAGKPLNYRMVDEGRIKPMSYKVVGKETITVNGKQEQATKVSRVDGDKELIAWVVKDLPVPARLLQKEKGQDALDLTIKALR